MIFYRLNHMSFTHEESQYLFILKDDDTETAPDSTDSSLILIDHQ